VIGIKFDAAPFGFRDPGTGEVEGFDVDVGRAVASALGVRPRFVEAVSDNRIPLIQAGEVDLVLSTMTITRRSAHGPSGSRTPTSSPTGASSCPTARPSRASTRWPARRVHTAQGSTYQLTLAEEAPAADLRLVDTYSECLALLQDGAVDVIVTDDVILTGMIIRDGSLRLVGDDLTTGPYGAGLAAGDEAYADFLDEVLERFKADGRWAAT
jgi:ABC-type amino acid transport substrate-binding protein